MDKDEALAIAVAVSGRLFINGSGEEASRLVLELPDNRDGGGWCQSAVIDQIVKVLMEPGAKR